MQLSLTSTNVWIADRAIDFRKSIDGLCDLVHHAFERNPADGIFVFYNRQRNKVKVLAWHGNLAITFASARRWHDSSCGSFWKNASGPA